MDREGFSEKRRVSVDPSGLRALGSQRIRMRFAGESDLVPRAAPARPPQLAPVAGNGFEAPSARFLAPGRERSPPGAAPDGDR